MKTKFSSLHKGMDTKFTTGFKGWSFTAHQLLWSNSPSAHSYSGVNGSETVITYHFSLRAKALQPLGPVRSCSNVHTHKVVMFCY